MKETIAIKQFEGSVDYVSIESNHWHSFQFPDVSEQRPSFAEDSDYAGIIKDLIISQKSKFSFSLVITSVMIDTKNTPIKLPHCLAV